MIPALLPGAAVIIAILGVVLIFFVRWYVMPRPGTAIVIPNAKGAPHVLLRGGRFVGPKASSVETLELMERDVSYDFGAGEELAFRDGATSATVEIRLTPNETDEAILSIVRSVGVATANDPVALRRLIEEKVRESVRSIAKTACVEDVESSAHAKRQLAALGDALADVAPGFHVDDVVVKRGS